MWIWQDKNWPNFSFDTQALQSALAAARMAQGHMLGIASQLQLVQLADMHVSGITAEALATAQIEGEVLHPQSVRASAARRLSLDVAKKHKPPSNKHIRKNYKLDHRAPPREEATLDVVEAAVRLWQQPLSEAQLFSWHAALFPAGYSGPMRIAVGAYRNHSEPMQIVTPQIGGNDIIHYQAPPSDSVPQHMQQLIAWFNTSQGQIDGITRAAIAHLWLEAIHPLEDGNGRIGRALSDLALAQDAHSSQRLFSLSHQLLAQRNAYYDQLQAHTGKQAKGSLNATAWVQWFAQRVQDACAHSSAQMHAALAPSRYWVATQAAHPAITPSQRKVLAKLLDAAPSGFEGGLSTDKYTAITGLSRATAYRELTQLLEVGLLVKTGVGKATRYGLV